MTDETTPMFRVNGKDYPMPSDLTLGEMCDAEQFFGVEFGSQATSGVRMAAALLWIAIKREDESVTVADIRELPPEVFATLTESDASPPEPKPDARPSGLSAKSGSVLSNGSVDLDASPALTGHPS